LKGRIQAVRNAGSKLAFVDFKNGNETLQAIVQLNKLDDEDQHYEDDVLRQKFKQFATTVRKGDWWEFKGRPHRSQSGELSILAATLPRLLSPSLHQIPGQLEDVETRAKNRHVDMLTHPAIIRTMRIRHLVEKHIRDFFDQDGFTAVHTPILTAGAGGAVARPFETMATELEGEKLNLRVAPELWLKRLVVGGVEKVYELGPAFRNEGVDATHNPEFYICEFYEAFATFEHLMCKTEALLAYIDQRLSQRQHEDDFDPKDTLPTFSSPFNRVEFLPALQHHLGYQLPDLDSPTALDDLTSILKAKDVTLPAKPTLPCLLDTLSSHFLEPLCDKPTFIINHPACLSPLAKHFICPRTGQTVAARAELFVNGRELANMYEEENSPFSQRQKFIDQLKYRTIDGEGDAVEIDESYVQALEWGLPPTGGWGCGVDRIVMLFTGDKRMADVLPFGTLRNVVGIGKGRRS
jgi:lysyl-tRNA synthetase, class II